MATLVFVHGWSVTSTATYGALPAALQARAQASGTTLDIANVYLSEFVTFVDAVTMDDLVRAFDSALRALSLTEDRFDCITHSTGSLVIRQWLRARELDPGPFATTALRHLVMLAPANFGSALAQLGKSRVGRLKAWWNSIEPGQRILDWLELGSGESLALNLDHIHGIDPTASGTFMHVLSGDRPDRSLYDHLNSYTGEDGSDGVVRLASANLNAIHVALVQQADDGFVATVTRAPRTVFRLVPGAAHSGEHGIMAAAAVPTVDYIEQCLAVHDVAGYHALADTFDAANHARDADKVEHEPIPLFAARTHVHDPRSMLTLRLRDDRGEALHDAQFLLMASGSIDMLPRGFMLDRQANQYDDTVVTLFLNHCLMTGDGAVVTDGMMLRGATPGHGPYGAIVRPADASPLVTHATSSTDGATDLLGWLGPHQTTIVDVVMRRQVHEGVFRLRDSLQPHDFSHPVIGAVISSR